MEDHILIVGNHETSREVMSRLFDQANVEVRWMETVSSGLEALVEHPAVILLDLDLPDGTGIEVLKAVRESGFRSKVAVLSAGSNPLLLAQLVALHPDAIFGKPLDFEDFVDWLVETFDRTQEIQATLRVQPGLACQYLC
ncbi:MAG TPA: response regulator [Tepidisphaeraceae bacterium]|jgi:CheY-like chemotaxis protein|nr:response regulator [Tepidisphaeraceae bacterium]